MSHIQNVGGEWQPLTTTDVLIRRCLQNTGRQHENEKTIRDRAKISEYYLLVTPTFIFPFSEVKANPKTLTDSG